MKICKKCLISKPEEDFYFEGKGSNKRASTCKFCKGEQCKEWRLTNKKKVKEMMKSWYVKNKDKAKKQYREWVSKNPERARSNGIKYVNSHREHLNGRAKQWAKDNRDRKNENQRRWRKLHSKQKRKSVEYLEKKIRQEARKKLSHNISTSIRNSLSVKKGFSGKNGRHWEGLVGFSLDELKQHLEKRFLPGMTWENRKQWHIDHKIPVSAFNFQTPDDIDFHRCWTIKNLQPLWVKDNIKKRNKLKEPFQPALGIKLSTSY